jgi:lipopolysaccharide export LptBFGC system permease protein LptF
MPKEKKLTLGDRLLILETTIVNYTKVVGTYQAENKTAHANITHRIDTYRSEVLAQRDSDKQERQNQRAEDKAGRKAQTDTIKCNEDRGKRHSLYWKFTFWIVVFILTSVASYFAVSAAAAAELINLI